MRVLVTGATGFLGSHLADVLIARGHEVVAAVRPTSDTRHLRGLGASLREVVLADPADLGRALAGCDAVVHAAGGGKVRSAADFEANNVAPSRSLAAALRARRDPLRRAVLVSSLAAAGPSPDGRPVASDAPPHPRSRYGRAKLAAEAALLEVAHQHPLTILRPPAVYGPRDTRMVPLYRAVARRRRFPVVDPAATTSLVYGPDCAVAIALALERDHPTGAVYTVADGPPYGWSEIGQQVAGAVGVSARPLRVPGWLLAGGAMGAEAWGRVRGRGVALTRDKVRDMLARHWVCDATAIRRDLGWEPSLRHPEGARATAAWYREQGWI